MLKYVQSPVSDSTCKIWVDTHLAHILRQMLSPRYVFESQLVVSKKFYMYKDAGWENNELLHLIDGKCDGSCHEI